MMPPGVQAPVTESSAPPPEEAVPFWGRDWTRGQDARPDPQMDAIMYASAQGRVKALLAAGPPEAGLVAAIMADPVLSRVIDLTIEGADLQTLLAELAG